MRDALTMVFRSVRAASSARLVCMLRLKYICESEKSSRAARRAVFRSEVFGKEFRNLEESRMQYRECTGRAISACGAYHRGVARCYPRRSCRRPQARRGLGPVQNCTGKFSILLMGCHEGRVRSLSFAQGTVAGLLSSLWA